jgi:class 3 adenylate cyclase
MKHRKAWADNALDSLRQQSSKDYEAALEIADSAFAIYHRLKDTCGMISAKVSAANHLDRLGKTDQSIASLIWSLDNFNADCDSVTLMEIYTNLSSTYISLGDFNRVDSICTVALSIWTKRWNNSDLRFALMTNQGIALVSLGDTNGSYVQFHKLMLEARAQNDSVNTEDGLINMGTIWALREEWDSAYAYLYEALESLEKRNAYQGEVELKINIAAVQNARGRGNEALALLDEVDAEAREHSDLLTRSKVAQSKAITYRDMGDYKSSVFHYESYISLRDSVLNEERIRSVNEMQEKFETEKRKREIRDLEVKNLDSELVTERVRRGRNLLTGGGLLVLLLATGLWSRLRYVRKSRAIIAKERDRSENLLLNILPAEIAEELKDKGHADARDYDMVSILFTDFKEFTQTAEKMSATELVAEINVCFKEFDAIVAKYGIEKIKTIGDAYMAAGSLPVPDERAAYNTVMAALEMSEFIVARKALREAEGKIGFEMRVGIHTGPVVAGIVGVKKFQYDIWGDTVNTASRMESHGEVGKVNISGTTYALVRSEPPFRFEPRGKIDVKGKGEVEMYFVGRG